jgi:hypothetical protein
MAFLLNGRRLGLDTPFEHNGFLYPANWLRLASAEDKAAIGVTEVADEPVWDQRFYWGYTGDGSLIPKDHEELKKQWVATAKQTAGQMLAQTDWMVVRQMDAGVAVPQSVKEWRAAIRVAADEKEALLNGTADTASLAEFVSSSSFFDWPQAS